MRGSIRIIIMERVSITLISSGGEVEEGRIQGDRRFCLRQRERNTGCSSAAAGLLLFCIFLS